MTDKWQCSCGETEEVNPEEYLHIGTPMCMDCDLEMTMVYSPTYEQVARHIVAGYNRDALITAAVSWLVASYTMFSAFFEGDKREYLEARARE